MFSGIITLIDKPEMAEFNVDSWSVGVIIYGMLTNVGQGPLEQRRLKLILFTCFPQNMPFDENPEDPVHVRIRRRLDTAFDSELLVEIGISADGEWEVRVSVTVML